MKPIVRFLPSGGVLAVAMGEGEESRIRLYDNPVELANAPKPERGEFFLPQPFPVLCGADALSYFFEVAPFLPCTPVPGFLLGEKLTAGFRAAFALLTSPETRFMRGEIGGFLIGTAITGGAFRIAGITAAPRTLTVRLEDVWLNLPPAARALSYDISITRDANRKDPPDAFAAGIVRESFPCQPGNTRVVLDLAANGGFSVDCTRL